MTFVDWREAFAVVEHSRTLTRSHSTTRWQKPKRRQGSHLIRYARRDPKEFSNCHLTVFNCHFRYYSALALPIHHP
jgi:hypothetical protein